MRLTHNKIIYYIPCTGKYHESVGRIGTSAAGTSANTADRRVIFPSTRCIMHLSCTTRSTRLRPYGARRVAREMLDMYSAVSSCLATKLATQLVSTAMMTGRDLPLEDILGDDLLQ